MTHYFQLGGLNIVIDCNSGSLHACGLEAYDLIKLRESSPDAKTAQIKAPELLPNIPEAVRSEILGEIEQLIEQGKLFSHEITVPESDGTDSGGVVKALCLNVSHACNLKCDYCFAGGAVGEGELMSFETGKSALDFLVSHSGSRTNLEVDFFGGEPLLNWNVVTELVKYARSLEPTCGKKFRFTLTTNGLLLDDNIIEFANREFVNVVLSLDGRKEVHDKFRCGSYNAVVPKLQNFVSKRSGSYYLRGTYTKENLDFTADLQHMRELGFRNLSIEPVVCDSSAPYSLDESHLPVLFRQYELLADMMAAERDFTFYHYNLDLENGPCLKKRISGCGSGSEYLAVTPDGTLYPCHQFVGDPAFIMGNVNTGVTESAVREKFTRRGITSTQECKICWARLWCSGGCAANSYHASGTVDGIYTLGCELFKKRLECAVYLQFKLAGAN